MTSGRGRSSLEQLFGSKVRVRLLRLFLENPSDRFYVREITRRIGAHIHSVRREISNLQRLGLVAAREDDRAATHTNRRYYEVRPDFLLFEELRSFILKSHALLQSDFARALQEKGDIRYLAFTGSFVGDKEAPTDMLIVGRVNKEDCRRWVRLLEQELGRLINYTLMVPDEYEHRKRMTDRFIYRIFESPKIILVDALQNFPA